MLHCQKKFSSEVNDFGDFFFSKTSHSTKTKHTVKAIYNPIAKENSIFIISY